MHTDRTHRTIHHENQAIEFQLIQTKRRSLGILVRKDQQVVVRAPKHATIEAIEQRVREKAPWILKHRERYAKLKFAPEKTYVQGEKHF